MEGQTSGGHCEGDLLRRLRRRDRQALARVAREYGQALVRAAYLYLGDVDDAEDVAQDTLIAAWDAARRTRPDTRLRPWLFGILFNRCRKHRRSLWRRIRRRRLAAGRRSADPGDDDNDEQLERLRRALARLDENLRAVVILRYERGLSVAQAAQALQLAEGTVKSRTHAAVQKLRDYMRQMP